MSKFYMQDAHSIKSYLYKLYRVRVKNKVVKERIKYWEDKLKSITNE